MIYLLIPEEEIQKIEEERFNSKVGGLPAKADPLQQEEFKKKPGTNIAGG